MTLPHDEAPDLPPRFGRYEVKSLLGKGNSGIVYRGFDPDLDREVAIKVLRTKSDDSTVIWDRLMREGRRAAHLKHTNIAEVYDHGWQDGQPYLVSEFVDGKDLKSWLDEFQPSWEETAKIVRQLANGLAFIHEARVIHRDVKPSNIIITNDLRAMLVDFDVAISVAEAKKIIQDGSIQGTPPYLSPEQARGEANRIDGRTDIFGLGAVFYEMLAEHPPFDDHQAADNLFLQTVKEPAQRRWLLGTLHTKPVTPPSQMNSDIPTELEQICLKCLNLNPEDRYPSAAHLTIDLSRWLDHNRERNSRIDTEEKTSPGQLHVSLSDLRGGHGQLQGRREQLDKLDSAWQQSSTNLLSIVAGTGVGKTSLVRHWLQCLAETDFDGIRFVFGSTLNDEVEAPKHFIDEALRFFGDKMPAEGTPRERGERLGRLIGQERALLILDGLEVIQTRIGGYTGRITDPAVDALLQSLALNNTGLCVLTTQVEISDIESWSGVDRIVLDELSPEEGAEVLSSIGVKGPTEKLKEISEEFSGHALALNLLGTYLRDVWEGDYSHWSEICLLDLDVRSGGQSQRVMKTYDEILGANERTILRIIGVNAGPVGFDQLVDLSTEPRTKGLTDAIVGQSEPRLREAIATLRKARLVFTVEEEAHTKIDAHVLVREYFARQVVKPLLKAIHRPNSSLGGFRAIEALARIRDESAVRPLEKILRSRRSRSGLVVETALALGRIGSQIAVDALAHCLFDFNKNWRGGSFFFNEVTRGRGGSEAAAKALGMIGGKKAIAVLCEALGKPKTRLNWFLDVIIVKSLAQTRDPLCVDALIDLIKRNELVLEAQGSGTALAEACIESVELLGDIGDPKAVEILIDVMHRHPTEHFFVVQALGKIGDPRAEDVLIEALRSDQNFGSSTLWQTINALRRCGTRKAVFPLCSVALQLNLGESFYKEWGEFAEETIAEIIIREYEANQD